MNVHHIILLTALSLIVNGCGMVPISARYTPTGEVRSIVKAEPKLNLRITDSRAKKVFFRTALGDTPDEGGGALLRLDRSPSHIFDEGFTEALQAAGCCMRDDGGIEYAVSIKRFLAIDLLAEKGVIETDILLDVQIRRSGSLLAKKTIFERDSEEYGLLQAWQHVLPGLLSRSLSRAIESAVLDPELNAAIERANGLASTLADLRKRLDEAASRPVTKRGRDTGMQASSLNRARTQPPRPKSAPVRSGTRSPFSSRYVAGLGDPQVVIQNNSGRTITIRLTGPKDISFSVKPRSSVTETLPGGSYSYNASASGVSPASGTETFATNHRYTWSFMIITIP